MTGQRTERIALLGLEAFAAVSALAGGIGLIGGGIEFPSEWLDGTHFSSYTIPGVILILVGIGQAVALAMELRPDRRAGEASMLAGLVMMGWIAGELLIVGSRGTLMLALQLIYFVNGLMIDALAYERWRDRRPSPQSEPRRDPGELGRTATPQRR
jgi:hypothetical protein